MSQTGGRVSRRSQTKCAPQTRAASPPTVSHFVAGLCTASVPERQLARRYAKLPEQAVELAVGQLASLEHRASLAEHRGQARGGGTVRPDQREKQVLPAVLARHAAGQSARRHEAARVPPETPQREQRRHSQQRPREKLHREPRSEEHTSELQSPCNLVCRLLLEKKKKKIR